jgi:hypothetical protein
MMHKGKFDGKDDDFIIQLAAGSMVEGQWPPNVCPLCSFTPKGEETWAPPSSTPKRVSGIDTDCVMEESIPVSPSMEMHIIGHLQFLMLLSLRLLDAQNTKADNDSQSGSETPKGASIGSDTGTRVDWDLESMTLLSFSTPPQIPSPELSEYSNTILPHHNIPEEEASFVPHITVHDIRSSSGPSPKGLGVPNAPPRLDVEDWILNQAEPLPNTAGEQFSPDSNPFYESYQGFFNDPPYPQEDRGVTATNTGGADTAHPPAEGKRKAEHHQGIDPVGLLHIRRPLMPPRRSYSVTDQYPIPRRHKLVLMDLPGELHFFIMDFLDPIDSTCLGLANRHFYAIHRRLHGTVPR